MTPADVARLSKMSKILDAAAEAAHDRHYGITAATSDMGLAFEDERTKQNWREVVIAVLAAVEKESV